MIALFEPKNISKSSSNYNLDKLLWLNAHYIKNKPHDELAKLLVEHGVDIREHDKKDLILSATKERGKTLVELAEQVKMHQQYIMKKTLKKLLRVMPLRF